MKCKGFTLIELLAVIVILAIIALIATPIIIGLIDDTRKEAFKDGAYGIVKSGEVLYSKDLLNGTIEAVTFTYTNGVESSNVAGKVLNYKGTKPQNGMVKVNNEGQVAIAIHNGTYCASKGFNDKDITLSEVVLGACNIPLYADASGASIPELTTGMIAVKWDGTNWVKADTDDKWYDYNDKKWANAVTVTSTNRATLLSAAAGTVIPLSDINTMWVWIPRYKYAIPAGTGARSINIVFESKTTTKSTGNAVDTSYLTHPAFTFGSTEVNGMWVGKFETTGTIASPTILPNTTSLRSQTVKAMYDSSRAMQNNTTYGTSTDGNIHMAKDSEWGAVAYLSHSQYGINSEIYKNNSSNYITGRSGGNVGGSQVKVGSNEYINTGFYTYDGKCATTTTLAPGVDANCIVVDNDLSDKTLAYKASTTGNIYGLYDMSGGAWEYTMSMYRPTDATSVTDSSGFGATTTNGTLPTSEYWNRYTTTTATTACSSEICYGNTLSETSGWYSDGASFVIAIGPWSLRGGYYYSTALAGAFYFGDGAGGAHIYYSFRLVQMKP
ncbi:MAG: prepilin-type N-terminal cleavage/methylation domain-containing protein [Ignavibacteriales bacterium]